MVSSHRGLVAKDYFQNQSATCRSIRTQWRCSSSDVRRRERVEGNLQQRSSSPNCRESFRAKGSGYPIKDGERPFVPLCRRSPINSNRRASNRREGEGGRRHSSETPRSNRPRERREALSRFFPNYSSVDDSATTVGWVAVPVAAINSAARLFRRAARFPCTTPRFAALSRREASTLYSAIAFPLSPAATAARNLFC